MTMTGYSPGGNGRSSDGGDVMPLAPPAVRVAEPAGLGLEHPEHDLRIPQEERLDRRAAHRQAAQRRDGDDVCGRGLAEQDRHLAEELPALHRHVPLAVD